MTTPEEKLADALAELAASMSDMQVTRLPTSGRRKAQTTSEARRAQRKKADRHVRVVQVAPEVMDVAKVLADGDVSRVKVQPDGTVLVVN